MENQYDKIYKAIERYILARYPLACYMTREPTYKGAFEVHFYRSYYAEEPFAAIYRNGYIEILEHF